MLLIMQAQTGGALKFLLDKYKHMGANDNLLYLYEYAHVCGRYV